MPRGDGRLSHDLDPQRPGPQDECGVFGVWAPGEEVAKLTYFGLYALQHRGQEAAGIAVERRLRRRGLQGPRPGRPGLRRADAGQPARPHRGRPRRYSHHRRLHLGERAADAAVATDAPAPRSRWPTTATWSTPPSWPSRSPSAACDGRLDLRHRPGDRRCWPPDPDLSVEAAAMEVLPHAARRVQLRLHGREHALRRPRPARRAPAGARPAGARLGGRQRDRRAGHRRRQRRPRGRAGRADRDRRARPALAAVRRARAQGLPVRVRLPGPPGHHDRRPQRVRRPGRDRPHAGQGAPGRGRPGDPGARSRAPRPRSATPRRPASRTARAW